MHAVAEEKPSQDGHQPEQAHPGGEAIFLMKASKTEAECLHVRSPRELSGNTYVVRIPTCKLPALLRAILILAYRSDHSTRFGETYSKISPVPVLLHLCDTYIDMQDGTGESSPVPTHEATPVPSSEATPLPIPGGGELQPGVASLSLGVHFKAHLAACESLLVR